MNTHSLRFRRLLSAAAFGLALGAGSFCVNAAGMLTPIGAAQQPLQLESHHVAVIINNGFARTEVEQVFYNPNPQRLEAIYATPIPERAALAEVTLWIGERTLVGEVVSKQDADALYEEEKAAGNDAGKASQTSYQRFEFNVSGVPAQDRVRMRSVYYEPLPIDSGVGRYTYRLEEGGTDEAAASFWALGDAVAGETTISVQLRSAWPVSKVRAPNFDGAIDVVDERTINYRFERRGGQLDQDFVFYYMLEENLPGRLELITYRESEDKPGVFMMALTPGTDLQPLANGADFAFVLDTSGSMQGKLNTLVAGVKKALDQMKPEDRFRIVVFGSKASDLSRGWVVASPENVERTMAMLDRLTPNGSTNLYAGVSLGLADLDPDRVSSLILVTDGVTNEGIVDPAKFYALMHGQDVRFFGFLLGNSSNWPLLKLMCEASGGYYRSVSNNDDIIGEILLAKSKIVHESLHDAELAISGVAVFDVSEFRIGKIHYGQQLILFGRYEGAGIARVRLDATIGGQQKLYETEVDFPAIDIAYPEIERLWALDQAQKIELGQMAGFVDERESKQAIRDLGIAYQIVTNETSMIVLDDAAFARRGIERRNEARSAREAIAAQENPSRTGAQRADANKPMYTQKAPSYGGGAIDPMTACLVVAGALAMLGWRRRQQRARSSSVALFALAAIAGVASVASARAENGSALPRWTERDLSLRVPASSIDHSIASFWEVSEAEAQEAVKPAARAELQPASVPVSEERTQDADTRSLRQTRSRNGGKGHFGINLFNAIPIIDFVWGSNSESQNDEYDGAIRR